MNKSSYTGYSDARKKCNAKYKAEKLESIQVYVPKGKKDLIKEFAKRQGMSMNQFIIAAIESEMEKDNMSETMEE